MDRYLSRNVFAPLLMFAVMIVVPASFASANEVLMSFPNGTYLENIAVRPDGAVVFTSYFDRQVLIWQQGAGGRVLATLPDYTVNVIVKADQLLVLTHGKQFVEGPAALAGSNRLYWLDASGSVVRKLDLPDLVFGNGMIADGDNALLITDAAAGLIRRVDLSTGKAETWFDHATLKVDPAQPKGQLGVNGLKRDGDSILFTNSAGRALHRLLVRDGRAAGEPRQVAVAPGADDIAVGPDGTVYLATHRETVVAIKSDGQQEVVADKNVLGATSVALSPDGTTLYMLGTGGLYEGQKEQATLVRVLLKP